MNTPQPGSLDERGPLPPNRRAFLRDGGLALGAVALQSLLARDGRAAQDQLPRDPLAPRAPHFAPKAKRMVHLFMAGGPSHLDLFDEKPELRRLHGQSLPDSLTKELRYAFIRPDATVLRPAFEFARHGQSGATISSALRHLPRIADKLCFVRSMHTDQFNHAPAQLFLLTGGPLPGRPSMGAWVSYGLGSECQDLPAYVVLSSGGGTSGGVANFSSGFLPTSYQGVPLRSKGDAILDVSNPAGVDERLQRDSLDVLGALNRRHRARVGDPEIDTRIRAYELAFRMQASAPGLLDLSDESPKTFERYGAEPGKPSYALHCLLARRLIERGVRFVQLFHKGWDHHSDVKGGLEGQCRQTDQASVALVEDLDERGLLDDTLVLWGGEFGRTPMVETNPTLGRSLGRDHHPKAFSLWMAGGGVKPGFSLGETDELGWHVTRDPVHVHDLQATVLHLLGLDHEKLTYRFQGREFRLTDVHGEVVHPILA